MKWTGNTKQGDQNHDANIDKVFLVWAYCNLIGSQLDSLYDQALPRTDNGSIFCHI